MAGVEVYQMTDNGLLTQAMLEGTKYRRHDLLNAYEEASGSGNTMKY